MNAKLREQAAVLCSAMASCWAMREALLATKMEWTVDGQSNYLRWGTA